MKLEFYVIVLFLFWGLTSCNVTKDLQVDEYLITKTTVKFKNPEEIKKKKKLKIELTQVLKPQANSGPLKLGVKIYQIGEKSNKKKGVKKWLQKNFGEKPAYYDEITQSNNRLRLKKLLKNNGYLRSDIIIDTLSKGKKMEMTYHIITNGQYQINQIFLPSDTTAVGRLVHWNQKASLLKEGDPYSGIALKNEQIRLSNIAAQNGYVDFKVKNIYFLVDTLPESLGINIYVRIQPPTNGKDHQQFRIGKTVIHSNYDLSNPNWGKDQDTVQVKPDLTVLENDHLMDFRVLDRMILQNENDIVSQKLQNTSVGRLLSLGIYKFVNLKYEKKNTPQGIIVDRNFYLTPDFNQKVSGNLELNNRTGRFYGIAASGSYLHKNVLKRAITFNSTISGGAETQIGNNLGFINTIDLNAEANLSIPVLKIKSNSALFVPRMNFKVANNFQRRIDQFSINSSTLKLFGLQFKETPEKQHQINFINVNRVNVLNKTPAFEALLAANPRLENSFSNLFIGGLDYTFTYTDQVLNLNKGYWFFKGNARLAGNILHGLAGVLDLPQNSNGQNTLLSLPYAQFISVEADLRFYKKFYKLTFASRFSPAIGYGYGNSSVLPYTEQFFVGGANSLRAFRLRGVGPGGFVSTTSAGKGVAGQFLDQTGDVKLEWSGEVRFGILGYFKGAFFVDAGNVWLLNQAAEPNQKFNLNNLNQIAVGAGIGLRFDMELVVLRLDLATPIRKPFLNEGIQWVNDFNIGSPTWRNENLILNLAIGYPF